MNRGICILFRVSSDPLAFIGSSGYSHIIYTHTHTYTMLNEFLRSKSEKKCNALSEKKDGAINEWIGPERKCDGNSYGTKDKATEKLESERQKNPNETYRLYHFFCLCRRNDIISWLYYTYNPHQCTFIFTHSNVLLTFILFLWVSVITSFGMWVSASLPSFVILSVFFLAVAHHISRIYSIFILCHEFSLWQRKSIPFRCGGFFCFVFVFAYRNQNRHSRVPIFATNAHGLSSVYSHSDLRNQKLTQTKTATGTTTTTTADQPATADCNRPNIKILPTITQKPKTDSKYCLTALSSILFLSKSY